MKNLICALAASLFATLPASAQSVEGDWQGTLKVGGAELRVVVHLLRDEKGLKGTLDSPDQGASGIPITTASVTDSTLKLDVQAVRGSFAGKISTGATAIAGTWTQGGQAIPLEFTRVVITPARTRVAKPSDIDGDWSGALESGAGALRLVLHILTYDDGMTAKLDSVDQNGFGIPVTSIARDGTNLRFEMRQIGGAFVGTVDKELTMISGTWTQLGESLSLTLTRVRK
jgi:serine-type D-Ala-D-Ala carboxypeptidase/endopeptidase